MNPTASQPPPDAAACVAEDLPSELSIELDAGQIFALAHLYVHAKGGEYGDAVRDIADALDYLRGRFSGCRVRPEADQSLDTRPVRYGWHLRDGEVP